MTLMMNKVCYVEDPAAGRDVPPGFCVRELTPPKKQSALAQWLGTRHGTKRIVYRERCRLSWDDLELVSFVPQGSSRGAWCSCDLFVELKDPGELSRIFRARNQIAHEMDVDFAQPNRNRRPRTKDRMAADTNAIFKVSNAFLTQADEQLR